jgi:hypothetical protein
VVVVSCMFRDLGLVDYMLKVTNRMGGSFAQWEQELGRQNRRFGFKRGINVLVGVEVSRLWERFGMLERYLQLLFWRERCGLEN